MGGEGVFIVVAKFIVHKYLSNVKKERATLTYIKL